MLNLFQLITNATDTIAEFTETRNVDLVGIFSAIEKFLNAVNNWLYSNIGIYLFELLRLIGKFFIWILKFVIDLVQYGLSFL